MARDLKVALTQVPNMVQEVRTGVSVKGHQLSGRLSRLSSNAQFATAAWYCARFVISHSSPRSARGSCDSDTVREGHWTECDAWLVWRKM